MKILFVNDTCAKCIITNNTYYVHHESENDEQKLGCPEKQCPLLDNQVRSKYIAQCFCTFPFHLKRKKKHLTRRFLQLNVLFNSLLKLFCGDLNKWESERAISGEYRK